MFNVDDLQAAILAAFDSRIALAIASLDKSKGAQDALPGIKTANEEAEGTLHEELTALSGHMSAIGQTNADLLARINGGVVGVGEYRRGGPL